ncbi:MAG: type II/IV secretion system ATPase subunit [Candidatus Altiarchaeota archaeon]
MGLKKKAAKAKKAAEVKERLAEVVGQAGRGDIDFIKESVKADEKEIVSAAKELDVEGVLSIKKHFLGKTELVSTSKAKHTASRDDMLELIERKGVVSVGKAASELKVSKEAVIELASDLAKEKLVEVRRRFMRDSLITANHLQILKYRVTKRLMEMRRKCRVIHTSADYILELAEGCNGLSVADTARVLGLSEAGVEEIVKRLEGLLKLEYPANPYAPPMITAKKGVRTCEEMPTEGNVLDSYDITSDEVPAKVRIISLEDESMPLYDVETPKVGEGTKAMLKSFAGELSTTIKISADDISDQKRMLELKDRFYSKSGRIIKENLDVTQEDVKILAGMMLHNMFGLGDIELLMYDDWLEEVCVNTSHIPVTVYHKRFGWLKTNITLDDERSVYNFASQIGRKVEKDITNLDPIMDAHLLSGDRVNATLFPISNFGNTITIRKFARQPWTITHYISPETQTLNKEMAAFLWMCFQYELNVIVGGGTASGKTSMLNCLCSLIQPTQRVITIEDTRELNLPKYLRWNWVPLTTRGANPEGKGEVSMLDLIVTSLRMRPDRVVFGEIRRRREAEVLFEAMHTGHSVYSTIHADTVENLKRRLIEPPIEIPASEIEALHLMLVVYRDRRKGDRRVFEMAEVIPGETGREFELNYLYRWNSRTKQFVKVNESKRIMDELSLHTGMSREDMQKDLKEKEDVLQWMVDKNIKNLDGVGEIMDEYYKNPKKLLEKVRQK